MCVTDCPTCANLRDRLECAGWENKLLLEEVAFWRQQAQQLKRDVRGMRVVKTPAKLVAPLPPAG